MVGVGMMTLILNSKRSCISKQAKFGCMCTRDLLRDNETTQLTVTNSTEQTI